MKKKNKKIIITGGVGFMGTNSAMHFYNKGWKVYLIDDCSRRGTLSNLRNLKRNINYKFFKIDIADFKKISKIISKIKPNLILHCAGQVAVTKSITDPRKDFNSNALGTFNILESIRLHSKKSRIIFISTNKVYGDLYQKIIAQKKRYTFVKKNTVINENQKLDFYTPYGCSKGSADQYVVDYSRIYNIDSIVLRLSCVYGIMQYGIEDHGWITWLTIASYFNKRLNVYGDGKQVRDILFIDDLVNLFYIISSKKNIRDKIYNVGGGKKNSISILELMEILKDKLQKKIKYKKHKWRQGDQKLYISDIKKIKKHVGWSPRIGVDKGLDKVINWIKRNENNIKKTLNV